MEKMLSLYDYLGTAAGKKLGYEVWCAAQSLNIPHTTRSISNTKYTGEVHLYPGEFLTKYFNNEFTQQEKEAINAFVYDKDKYDDLPF